MAKKVVGIDVGRGSITCCVLEELPEDLKRFSQKYRPITLKTTWKDAQTLLGLGDVFVLEPTGADYWIWLDLLAGQDYRLISGIRIRNYARTYEILNKGDREDAAVIAHYGLTHLDRPAAFLEVHQSKLKEYWNTLKNLPKIGTSYANKLRARASYEAPHMAKATATYREWGSEKASGLWREMAGVPLSHGKKRQDPEHLIGRGISWITQEIASVLLAHESLEAKLEQAISEEIEADTSRSMQAFKEVFQDWEISDRAATGILASCHPLEQFLSEDGKRIRSRRWNNQGTQRNGQDRSLKSFQRAMAYGQVKIQSGDKFIQVSTGDPALKTLLKNYLINRCVVARQPHSSHLLKIFGRPEDWDNWKKQQQSEWIKAHSFRAVHEKYGRTPWEESEAIESVIAFNGSTKAFAELQLFYEFAPQCQNLGKWKRIGKVYSRFVRMLFRDLVQKYQSLN